MADAERTGRILEVVAATLLALAAVAAAWAGYQSARWGGVQATHTANANAARLESARASSTGGQLVVIDVGTFFQAVDAFADDDEELYDFYRDRMREEFKPVFEEWLATDPLDNPDAPLSPFELDSYQLADLEEATRFDELAQEETESAAEARKRANSYTVSVVLLAAALFFAGISTKFASNRAKIVLLTVGVLLFVGVVTVIAAMPKSVSL